MIRGITRPALGLSVALLLAGCVSWPEHGQGGVAEEMAPPPPTITTTELAQLHADVTFAAAEVDGLSTSALKDWSPAFVHRLQMQKNLVERQLAGLFYANTRQDLDALQQLLSIAKQALDGIENPTISGGQQR